MANGKIVICRGDFMKKIFKIIGICIIVLFVLFCGLIFIQDNILYPNELYIKMNKINDDKSLMGLSETDIIRRAKV